MNLKINLSDEDAAVLEAQANAAHMPPDRYLSMVVERALRLESDRPSGSTGKPKRSAYGLLARYGPGPSEAEIDQNRREMFSGFGE
jgi:hypothetical protein